MQVKLLGTGAADGIPGMYSDSRVCEHARKHKGKNLRSRCGALVDKGLKIDYPPDTYAQMTREGLDAREWSAILFTHSHEDHFALPELQYALYPFVPNTSTPFTIYGNSAIEAKLDCRYPEWPIELLSTKSFVPFAHGDYQITPVAATHETTEDCQNFAIEKGGKKLLYATDTGVWKAPTWQFLGGKKFDALVIECTDGVRPSGYTGHLSVQTVIEVVTRMRAEGALHPAAKIVTTHHSWQGDATHEELEGLLRPHGIEVGYDGMTFDC